MKVFTLLLFIGLTATRCHAQVADSNTCVQVTVHVVNSKTKQPIKGGRVYIIGNTGYSKEGHTYNNGLYTTCLYPATYEASVSKEKYLPAGIPRKMITITNSTSPIDLTFELDSMGMIGDKFPVVPFETKKPVLNKAAIDTLNGMVMLLKDNTNLVLELMAYSDCRGSAKGNTKRAERYGNAVKDYLVARSIDAARLIVKTYGETQPLNKCKDGVKCSQEEHAINNRVWFKIIGYDYKTKP